MLDYLRDKSASDQSEPVSQEAHVSCEQRNSDGEGAYINVRDRSKNVRRTSCLFAFLFFAGLFTLWIMVKKSAPVAAHGASASKEDVQIEAAMTNLTGVSAEMHTGIEVIVNKFYEFSDFEQIKVDDLSKNPFEMGTFDMSLSQGEPNGPNSGASLAVQQQLAEQIKKMTLVTIMESSGVKCCMIDDVLLYEGDSIKNFVVGKIGISEVVLKSEGFELMLKMQD